MRSGIGGLFGQRRQPEEIDAQQAEIIPDARVYDIVDTYKNLSKPLGNHVSYDTKEWDRLRELRVDAFAEHHPSGHRPLDVFHELPIVPVNPDHMITHLTLKKSAPKNLPEFSLMNWILVISQRVRDALEELEPGRHKFFPLTLTWPSGGESYKYYFVQFLERLNCVCFPKSGFVQKVGAGGGTYWAKPDRSVKYYYGADCVGNRHLFWDAHAKGRHVASQALVDRLGSVLPRGIELVEGGLLGSKER